MHDHAGSWPSFAGAPPLAHGPAVDLRRTRSVNGWGGLWAKRLGDDAEGWLLAGEYCDLHWLHAELSRVRDTCHLPAPRGAWADIRYWKDAVTVVAILGWDAPKQGQERDSLDMQELGDACCSANWREASGVEICGGYGDALSIREVIADIEKWRGWGHVGR